MAAALAPAATPVIGIITASGHFTVEGSQVWGNSTLFDGATVETGSASSELALRNGVRVQLGSASRARVWENRLLLEKGVAQAASFASFEVAAAGLAIHTSGGGARMRVNVGDRIEVAALSGNARVASGAGVLLASIPTGRSASFSMQAAQSAVTRTGCLLYKDNRFILQDESTQQVIELNGPDLAANVGNRVMVSGAASTTRPVVSIATSVINVSSVAPQSTGGCLSIASGLGATTEVPGSAPGGTAASTTATKAEKAGGMSTGTKAILIGAVGGGGAAAAIALASGKKSTSP
jgi:hypothetical protein